MTIHSTHLPYYFNSYCRKTNYLTSLLLFLSIIPTFVYGAEQSELRGQRYCEIVLGTGLTHYDIYNTLGLNNCPQQSWGKIDAAKIKKETDASSVHLNGPRYWVIDGYKQAALNKAKLKTMGGLTMREAGVLNIRMINLLKASSPYYKHEIVRPITWIYHPDKPVYELIDGNGEVFVMQSYSTQKTAQTEKSLAELGRKLKLPKGWKFKTGVIKNEKVIKTINNMAIVVQDNFNNTYQKATEDFLSSEKAS
jgi:hypothetical protein